MQPKSINLPFAWVIVGFFLLLLNPRQTHAQNDSLVFGDKKRIPDGLKGKIYFLPENTEKLPYFDTLKSMGELYVKKLDIPERPWISGFPGVPGRNEWFAIVYTGYFKVKKAGQYTFRLLSDDGSKLYIDGKPIINNDGIHGPGARLGNITLNSSKHSIRVEYFQGPATQIALQLFVTLGSEVEQVFPGDNFILSSPADAKSTWMKYGLYIAILLILIILVFWWKRRSKKNPAPKPA